MSDSKAISIKNLNFRYGKRPPTLVLADLTIDQGERIFLYGPSGSGKTTLLGLLGGILKAESGSVDILGTRLDQLSAGARDSFRGSHVGFIFQMFNLIPYLSVEENMALPCLLNKERRQRLAGRTIHEVVLEFAQKLGLEAHLKTRVTDLSVGQQQRVAAARALIGSPEIVIADEPTSALDADHRASFIKLLFDMCNHSQATLVFVSHDQNLKGHFSRSLSLPELNGAAR